MPFDVIGTLAFIGLVTYLMSLCLYPRTRCRRCARGRHERTARPYLFRDCPVCSGTGRKRRLGVRLLGI
jgi:hypothetical protein